MSDSMNSVPRRIRLDLSTQAELAIRNAVNEVEKSGADERLTKAVTFLSKALELVSDYVDGNIIQNTQPKNK